MVPAWLWITWLAVAAASFAAIEGIAIVNRAGGDTLSERLRQWLGVDPPRPARRAAVAAFSTIVLGFVAWFVPHIVG